MTDPVASAAGAGALLKAAREQQGLHIAALAAAIKVTPRKLDALENDRWDELPDATFTRALAQTVCRVLKIDAAPVLERLPQTDRTTLDPGLAGLNTPFRGRAARDESTWAGSAVRPLMVAALLLMIAAVVVFLMPPGWLSPSASDAASDATTTTTALPSPEPAASGSEFVPAPFVTAPDSTAAGMEATAPATAAAVPAATAAATTAAAAPPAAAASGALQLRTSAPSWIQVRDGSGRVLLSRAVAPDENLALDGTPPLRLIVGNAAVTEIRYRGQPVDLAARSRENVARFDLP